MTHPSVNSIVERLEPCPFCGPGNSVVECYQDDYGGWRVGCGRCGSHSGFRPKSDPEARAKVIANWNKRPAESAAEIERLRREVGEANTTIAQLDQRCASFERSTITAESAVVALRFIANNDGNFDQAVCKRALELIESASAIRAAVSKKTAESGHSDSSVNSRTE